MKTGKMRDIAQRIAAAGAAIAQAMRTGGEFPSDAIEELRADLDSLEEYYEEDDLRDEDPAARAEREDWEDRHDGTRGAWNEPGAPFQGGNY